MQDLRIFLLIIILIIKSQARIPPYLIECYKNETFRGPQLPLNFQVFLDIIRKAEKSSQMSMDMRTLASSLLHRFKYDGIEFYQDIKFSEGILPFDGTGFQRTKNRLIEELIPGNGKLYSADSLSLLERCALHRAISNTIWEHETPDRETSCEQRPTEKFFHPSGARRLAICPMEQGVILTEYGTIAPGAIIAAVAAALQPQNVAVKLLLNTSDTHDFNEDEVDFIIPKSQMPLNKSMWIKWLSSDTELDNIWLATVAGELAELAVYQGPLMSWRMVLGTAGFWNSTMRPKLFYLLGRDGNFEATRAEIVGAIDGFIIAKNLKSWLARFNNLRLSQIIDMYYSSKGLIFDSQVRACERGKSFWYIVSRTVMNEQTYAASQVLSYRRSVASLDDVTLRTMVDVAVNKFTEYVNNHLFTELLCLKNNYYPHVEALVTFDGSWSREYTADFLAVLLEDLDVSMYGSKIGFIHGDTGKFLLNVTDSPAEAHEKIANFPSLSWPKNLNLSQIITQIEDYSTNTWIKRLKNHTIGGLGHVIIFLVPRTYLTHVEQQKIILQLKKLKELHPDINIIYYTTAENYESFIKLRITDGDILITSSKINDIRNSLLTVPRTLRPALCNFNVTQGTRDQLEDYVEIQQTIIYRLDPLWRINTKKIIMKIIGVGYGTLEICSWNQLKNNITRDKYHCTLLSGHGEAIISDYIPCKKDNCPAIFYQVRGLSSLNKCAEFECKAPHYIRYLIRMENQCSNAGKFVSNLFNISIAMILLTYLK